MEQSKANISGHINFKIFDKNKSLVREKNVHNAIKNDYGDRMAEWSYTTFGSNSHGSGNDPTLYTNSVGNATIVDVCRTSSNLSPTSPTVNTDNNFSYSVPAIWLRTTNNNTPSGVHAVLCKTTQPFFRTSPDEYKVQMVAECSTVHSSSIVFDFAYLSKITNWDASDNGVILADTALLVAEKDLTSSTITLASSDSLQITWTITLAGA